MSIFNDRLSINANVGQFVLLTLHSVRMNVQKCYRLHIDTMKGHAYFIRAIESFLHANEV